MEKQAPAGISDRDFRTAVTWVHRRYWRAVGDHVAAWNRWLDLKRSRPEATERLRILRRQAQSAEKESEKRLHHIAWTVSELRGLLSDDRNPRVRWLVSELIKEALKRPKKARKGDRR